MSDNTLIKIPLKPGKEKSLRNHHPWVFSGALARTAPNVQPGQTVDIVTHKGDFIARGAISPHSQIRVRVWTFSADESIDPSFFKNRLETAIQRRKALLTDESITGIRLVNAESDGLPGLIVDLYGKYLVVQFLCAGVEYFKELITDLLAHLWPCQGIFERSDADVRLKEGLKKTKGLLYGQKLPEYVEIREGKLKFLVDIIEGHKTGFYLDQRENRRQIQTYSDQAEVLNCFAYTGGFGVYALAGGARSLTNIEMSAQATNLIEEHVRINDLDQARVRNMTGDVFQILRQFRDQNRQFDLIVLDPPKFADSRGQLKRALRGYKDINWLAFRILRPGGILFTFSCSGLLEPALFQKVVADAALDANQNARIIQRLGQAQDHATALAFPEGTYLKGLVCQAD